MTQTQPTSSITLVSGEGARRDHPNTAVTAKNAFSFLHTCLRDTVTDGVISRHPMERLKPPKVARTDARALEPEQAEYLLKWLTRRTPEPKKLAVAGALLVFAATAITIGVLTESDDTEATASQQSPATSAPSASPAEGPEQPSEPDVAEDTDGEESAQAPEDEEGEQPASSPSPQDDPFAYIADAISAGQDSEVYEFENVVYVSYTREVVYGEAEDALALEALDVLNAAWETWDGTWDAVEITPLNPATGTLWHNARFERDSIETVVTESIVQYDTLDFRDSGNTHFSG